MDRGRLSGGGGSWRAASRCPRPDSARRNFLDVSGGRSGPRRSGRAVLLVVELPGFHLALPAEEIGAAGAGLLPVAPLLLPRVAGLGHDRPQGVPAPNPPVLARQRVR